MKWLAMYDVGLQLTSLCSKLLAHVRLEYKTRSDKFIGFAGICCEDHTGVIHIIHHTDNTDLGLSQSVSCPVYPAFDVGDRPHWT